MTNQNELNAQPAFHLFKDGAGLPIVSVNSDGSVVVNPDVSLDEAATAFWNVVRSVWDQHATPPSETELRAIHATAVAKVMTADKMLRPDVDAWWPHYLRSVLSQSSRPWFTSTSKNDDQVDDEPAHYQYEFIYPFDRTPIWRDDHREWNGQRPRATRALYTRPTPNELRQKMRDAQFAIDALHIVGHALGLPAGSNVTTDVVQAALDAQLEARGHADALVVELLDQIRTDNRYVRREFSEADTVTELLKRADAFVFSREQSSPAAKLSKAALDVIAERVRHVDGERFSNDHDDKNNGGDLAAAASAYSLNAACQLNPYSQQPLEEFPIMWPSDWAVKWWKPKTPREDLVRAGSLIVAEIERLDRLGDAA